MGTLLHVGATVLCAHSGQAKPMVSNPRVKVSGQEIVTQSSPYTVSGCSNPPPPAAAGPCVSAMWTTGATRVFANDLPVLLEDSQATCVPTGTPLSIVSTQTRVTGT